MAAIEVARGSLPSVALEAIARAVAALELACVREVRAAFAAGAASVRS
jgi:hypothetical protein